jgi:hypothetical protein
MQNEELLSAISKKRNCYRKYMNYRFFFTIWLLSLSKEGNDCVNLHGSEMLGRERFKLINSRLFFSDETKPVFNQF